MENKEIELRDYYYRKYTEALMYSKLTTNKSKYKITPEKDVMEIFSSMDFKKILCCMYEHLILLSENKRIDPYIKSNIFFVLMTYKNKFSGILTSEEEEAKEFRKYFINILDILNDKNNEMFRFCFYEEQKELRGKEYFIIDSEHLFDCAERQIRESIANDVYVLATHTDETNDELYDNIYMKKFSNNSLYLESLNAIIKEYPIILENETFTKRALKTLNHSGIIKAVKDNKSFFEVMNLLFSSYTKDTKDMKEKINGRER